MIKTGMLILALGVVVCYAQAELDSVIELVNKEQYAEAERRIGQYLAENKKDDKGNFIKALILSNQERFAEAILPIEAAIRLDKKNADYYQLAGQLYEQLDQKEKALSAWQNCAKYAKSKELKKEARIHVDHLSTE